MNTSNSTDLSLEAEKINFTALLNSFCREFNNWTLYQGNPKYDAPLAEYMESINHSTFLRCSFEGLGVEVYVPLAYFSETGIHTYGFPVVERNSQTQDISPISPYRFIDLVTSEVKKTHPEVTPDFTKNRLRNSISNLNQFLTYITIHKNKINQSVQNFIEGEQSLVLGHPVHPLPKSREGFNNNELERYSPETGGEFPLHFFLINPNNVLEKQLEKTFTTSYLRDEIFPHATDKVQSLLTGYPHWKVVPTHPWEAAYLLNQPEVKAMESNNLLFNLGELGPKFKATSSVQTVYNPFSDWMYKFSLHVKNTNSYRVNYPHELNRAYETSHLMKTPWGKKLEKDFPEVKFITAPAFIMVRYNGKTIDGFSTIIKENPFKGKSAKKNIGLVASLCQDGILGQPPRIVNLIQKIAIKTNKDEKETALHWFKQYLKISLKPLVGIFNQYGLSGNFHQQNLLVELDKNLFPCQLYYHGNLGFQFRQAQKKKLSDLLAGLSSKDKLFNEDKRLINDLCYHFIVNHLLGIINALGKNNLARESILIHIFVEALKAEASTDKTGWVNHLLSKVKLVIKANLHTILTNEDEANTQKNSPPFYKPWPNPLNLVHFSGKLIKPKGKETVYRRYFDKEDVTITIRPVDLERDLEMLHEWFHRPHAHKIWQMNWSLNELETYYRTLLPGNVLQSYIGETNGTPSFNLEIYWASRDIVGEHYEVLPNDYGTHFLIAPTDPKLKFTSPSSQAFTDFVFSDSKVGRMVGEGSVESLPSILNKTHLGFKIDKIIIMPHKTSYLNFCYREWYWEKFPVAKEFQNQTSLEPQL